MVDFDKIYELAIYWNCKLNKNGGVILSIIFGSLIRLIYPCDISAYASIGKNVKILHAIGIIIGGTAIIESNVTIMPNVVIGSKMIYISV